MESYWGDGRYYSDEYYSETITEEEAKYGEPLYYRWVEALKSVQDDAQGAVKRAKNKWNIIIRDRLRNETALRLTTADRAQSVPIKVVNGMPRPFLNVIKHFEDAEWAILNEATLRNVVEGTAYMSRHRPSVENRWPQRAGPAAPEDILRVKTTAEAWLGLISELRAVDRIVGINEDVLGAYFYKIPEIQLYWTVIGIVAKLINVSIESLTVVVLAHELSHAYTHLGYDIDNWKWDTDEFAHTDIRVVEGLAQFYTKAVCEHLHTRIPEAKDAFEKLLRKQGPAYTSFQQWIPSDQRQSGEGNQNSGEIIRASMIECRKVGLKKEQEFLEAMDHYWSSLAYR